eukprot:13220747-Alexandrium_andersonii.AAC.1
MPRPIARCSSSVSWLLWSGQLPACMCAESAMKTARLCSPGGSPARCTPASAAARRQAAASHD